MNLFKKIFGYIKEILKNISNFIPDLLANW